MKPAHEQTLAEFAETAPELARHRETLGRYRVAATAADRMAFVDEVPPFGSYRGTFREAFTTTPAQYEASQERDRTRAEWDARMHALQQETERHLLALRNEARAFAAAAERRRVNRMSATEAFALIARGMHRVRLRDALRNGRAVSQEVLHDYPELGREMRQARAEGEEIG